MSRKRYTPEQIISMLREAEVALAQGQSVGQACRTLRRIGAELLSLAQGIWLNSPLTKSSLDEVGMV